MNNVQIFLVVEGATEQTFIREVLAHEMAQKGIYLHAALIGKPGHKGGNVRFDRVKNDIGNFLCQRKNTFVSMMVDYFKMDPSWPGYDQVLQKIKEGQSLSSLEKAKLIQDETHKIIVDSFPDLNSEERFIPYISMHEFEALLFSDAEVLSSKIDVDINRIQEILNTHANPEEINDDPATAPSKRLEKLAQAYRKIEKGKEISEAIGIEKIRAQCPNFDRWLTRIEGLKP